MNKSRILLAVLFLIAGAGLFLLATWLTSSSLSNSEVKGGFPLRTSGWFILGMIFTLPVAFGFAGLFLLSSLWIGRKLAFISMMLISAALLGLAAWSSLPTSRLIPIIGKEAANVATIEILRVYDTFNDGTFHAGVLNGPRGFIALIETHRTLERHARSDSLVLLEAILEDVKMPKKDEVLSDAHGSFLCDRDGSRVYFLHTSRARPLPNGEPSG
jgi:hypothetical protein